MKFGNALRTIFEAHYRDAASKEPCTRYTNAELKEAFKTIPLSPRDKLFLYQEFSVIVGVLEREILSCKHETVTVPFQGCERCTKCLSMRRLERVDDSFGSYDESMKWGEWTVGYLTNLD